jgi:hypothetical protein
MPKDKFDDLRKRLQEAEDTFWTDERLLYESKLKNPDDIQNQLIIMDSGIFVDGQLKGTLIGSSGKPEKFQIIDVEDFLAKVANNIYYIFEKPDLKAYYILSTLGEYFKSHIYDSMINMLRKDLGINKVKKMENIKRDFIALRDEIFSKIDNGVNKVVPPNVDSLFYLFKEHIPDAHDQIVANRISELLTKFDIDFKAGTILQRMRRAKK